MNNSLTKTNTLPTKLKTERSMPKWVTEANDRIGPKPPAPPPSATTNGGASTFRPPALPPKKNQLEPDYEVIEFSSQQYSNEPTTTAMRPKTPDARRTETVMKCTLCGSNNPWVTCDECAQQIFCASCDDMFHKHPKRKTHLRKAIEAKRGSTPLIPPKALSPQAPVAPPRRNKRGMPSPMPLRRDQVIGSTATTPSVSPVPGSQQPQPAWQDRLGSLRRGLNLGNRPLPDTPRTPSDGVSSRSTTPNSKSVFDQIQKPPSITLEKIKTKASATLDRMALLQQRYRQHRQTKTNEKTNGQREQMLPSDQWSNISSPSQFRSGSMSSGINSFDYPDESPFLFNQQMSMGGMRGHGPPARNMSSSVFNLNQMSQRHGRDHQSPMWMDGGNQMQQAQSMAHLNCINCHSHGGWNQSHQHSEDWPGAANANLNRSNMSLNVTHGFYPSPHNQHMMHAPPVFMNMPGVYPYPMAMPVPINTGMMGMPSSARSRAASRASSRVPSPTHSRKSMQVRSKKRNDFSENELTDDEDSDNDDRRSLMSQRSGISNARRTRRVSSVSQTLEQEEPRTFRSKAISSRDRRGPSMQKSVQDDWTPGRRPSITSNANSTFNSYRKVYSDSPISPDSETSEAPPTRALVQAKIQEKMKESSTKSKPKPLVISDNEESTSQLPEPKSPIGTKDEVEYQNGEDLKNLKESQANSVREDGSSLGPPPSTPEHEWECEFCTFVNEPKTKICSICCKTPKQAPQKVKLIPQPPATAAIVSTSTTTTATVTNGIAKLKISQQTEDESEDYSSAAAKKKDLEEVEDIWATLDESIQTEAKKVKRNAETAIEYKKIAKDQQTSPEMSKRASNSVVVNENKIQKVSTGCGPSPPKEITRELRSTATSPVPQSMPSQTYESFPKRNEEKQPEAFGNTSEMSRRDFQNHSFTPPMRDLGNKETLSQQILPERSTSRDVESLAHADGNQRLYREMPGDRYRSSTDIRSGDLSPLMQQIRHQIPDYLSLQKAQTYHNDIFFDPFATSKRNEPNRDPEIELFMMLKEAEHYKFTAEELHAALKNCGDTNPIIWLRENWSKLVQTVQSLATKYGQERIENVIGTISAIEAREALRMHGGNVWQAISECVEQRQRKYLEISAKGNYSREDIVTALTAHHGNMDLALLDLSKTQLKPFLMRVWGSPGGVENESANFMQPPPPPSTSKSEISSPIHEFLTANAEQIAFTQDQASYRNAFSSNHNQFETKEDLLSSQSNNKHVLKDLEILIGNMEQVQAKQNNTVFRSMEDMLGNLLAKKPQPLEAELDTDSERIFMKSPIYSNRRNLGISTASNKTNDDVKNFVWQHIQDIVPNLVEQVERDLLQPSPPILEVEEAERPIEPPPIDADEFLMEEVIKPNLKNSIEEEEQEVQMEDVKPLEVFKPDEDRGFLKKVKQEFEFKSFENAPRKVYKMEIAPDSSSEEESSEEETSEEEDSQEEISARDAQTRSIKNNHLEAENTNLTVVDVTRVEEVTSGSNDKDTHVKSENVDQNTHISFDANHNQNLQASEILPSTSNNGQNPETKTEKIQACRSYAFRFGFNSSRRNRRHRTRRSIKREKKKNEIDNEETIESYQSEDTTSEKGKDSLEQQTPRSHDKISSDQQVQNNLNETETKSVENKVENLQDSPIQNDIPQVEFDGTPFFTTEHKHSLIVETKTNKNMKKRSNIPSRSKQKSVTLQKNQDSIDNNKARDLVENSPGKIPDIENNLNTENMSLERENLDNNRLRDLAENSPEVSHEIGNNDSSKNMSSENTELENLKPDNQTFSQVKDSNAAEEDSKPSTSFSHKTSQLKRPKLRNAVKNSRNIKTEEGKSDTALDPSIPSTSSTSKTIQNKPDVLNTSIQSSKDIQTRKENPVDSKTETPGELLTTNNVSLTTERKKPISRIPVRRTTSSTSVKSLENSPNSLTPTPTTIPSESPFNFENNQKDISTEDDEEYQDVQSSSEEEEEPDFYNAIEDVIQPNTPSAFENDSVLKEDDNHSDQELLSTDSEDPNTLSSRYMMQSPTSENEVLLILDNQSSHTPSTTITPVSSSKSIDFKYSDPAKQNLSELVEDTQRLIKQMKEEINIDMAAYDSEDDDGDEEEEYSDDYSYEEYEEEYEEETEDEEDILEEFEEEEESEDVEENSNAEHEEFHENQINQDMLKDEQEETSQKQIQIDSDKKLESLVHALPTDHGSLLVVETSSLSNTTLSPGILVHPNIVSVVSDELVEEVYVSQETDVSTITPDSITIAEPSSSEKVLENQKLQANLSDTLVGKGLKQVQSEMKKVLQPEIEASVTPIIRIEDSKPSTSKAATSRRENNQAEPQDDPQELANISKKTKLDQEKSQFKNQFEEVKIQNAEPKDVEHNTTNLILVEEASFESISKPPNPNTSFEEKKKASEIRKSELKIELSRIQENTEIIAKNSLSTSKDNLEPNIETITSDPKSSESETEIANTSLNQGEPHDQVQIVETIEHHSVNSDSGKMALTAKTNDPTALNIQLSKEGESTKNEKAVNEERRQISSSPSSLVSALQSILQSDEDPKSSQTKIPRSNQVTSAEKNTSQAFPAIKNLQTNFKDLENDDIPGTSKDSTSRKSPPKKTASKIPKPKINSKPTPIPTRSKSFSAPSPIGVSSVRAIQQELFNKQSQLAKTPTLPLQKPTPPKLVRKKSISDAISKFTQATSEHSVQRSRTQPKIPKIPKKKYHETCFSDDDYQDSSDGEVEPQPMEARLRKQSAPVFRTYASIKELQVEQPEICARRLIDEQLVSNMAEAQIAAALIGMRFQQDVSIWAAKECCDLEQAISLLQQECELCMGSYPMNKMVSMLKCTHKCCKQCAKNYFTIQITDRSINDCNCPFCKIPELTDPNVLEDENLEYFSNLDIFIKNIVEPEVHELFQRKLRDRTLMQDPNFKWCIQCSSGFFARPKQKRLICPDCGSVTCSQCRKTWEKQHEGLTCEKFQEWKDANDPEVQAKGVAEHLALNGIDCPKCRFKYSLARGGCMHFTCTQCKFEFCYGCGRPFMMGAKCNVSPYCSKLGLHSHHPRSCLFYLRDKEPHTLQNLLLQNDVSFDVDPIVVEGASKSETSTPSKCPIPLQKETPKGLVDTVCNTEVQKDHAGLCRQHYVEYLANKVSKANIDPLPILDLTDCVQELRRRGLPLPERGPWDTDEIYRDMCSKVIKEKIPL